MTTATIYRRMDAVMVKADFTDDWHLGIVDRDFAEGDRWVSATAKTSEMSNSFRVPGEKPEHVRLATEADIAAAPDYARTWLQEQRDREELRLLEQRDPTVRASNRKATAALRTAGIKRISDLERFTDKELLALDGIGKTFIHQWRQKEVAK